MVAGPDRAWGRALRGTAARQLALFAVAVAVLVPVAGSAQDPSPVAVELRTRIEVGCSITPTFLKDELVCAAAAAQGFYARRGFKPAWTGESGPLPEAAALVRALRGATEHGLRPRDYHRDAISARVDADNPRPRSALELAELDLLLTDAFLLYGAHLLAGRVDPETIHPDWISNPRTADVALVLERALASGRIEEELTGLAPRHPEYARLRDALVRYRQMAEGTAWPSVPAGPPLRRDDQGPRVATLRDRLEAEGYVTEPSDAPAELFDAGLEEALRRFQRTHGLADDGVCGPHAFEALDVPAADRVRQIEVNLERWRWLPAELGKRHLRVNVAGFGLEVFEDGRPAFSSRVVVGKPFTRTPVFSSMLTHVVVNPSWKVPQTIAREEILSAVKRDPGYLDRLGFRVFRGWGANERALDPKTVDWQALSPDRLNFRFRQGPGPANALGRIKFLLPNRFDVYLHDTPSRGLFSRVRRAFSHGCVRVARPVDLAEYLLRESPGWTREALGAAITAANERVIRLPEPMPVHVLYATAWAEEGGVAHFGEDVYARDDEVVEALEAPPPGVADGPEVRGR